MSQTIHACPCCDAWLDLPGLHVLAVDHDDHAVVVSVASDHAEVGCPSCGGLAKVHDRRTVTLIDAPAMGRPMRLRWVKHRYACREHLCAQHTFTETDPHIAPAGHLLTTQATGWAIEQLRREHASVSRLARQLGTSWKALGRAIEPVLQTADGDPARVAGVRRLGVDEHVWHHSNPKTRGPRMLTGMVDFAPDADGTPRTRLLDLVPGRSVTSYATWPQEL